MTHRPRILLVEDNRLLRWWLMIELYDAGFWVAGPDSTAGVIQWAKTMEFDVLLTDWRLQVGHDGFEILDHVRAHSPNVLPILMSAEMNEELARQARAVGFKQVLTKPFPPNELFEALEPAKLHSGLLAADQGRKEVLA